MSPAPKELPEAEREELVHDLQQAELKYAAAIDVLVALVNYCSDHDWGTIPYGETIQRAENLAHPPSVNLCCAKCDARQIGEVLGSAICWDANCKCHRSGK